MLETIILSNLLYNEDYTRKVFPYIKEEYFDDNSLKKIFSSLQNYINEYKEPPSIEALKISIDSRKDLNEQSFKEIGKIVDELKIDDKTNQEWLIAETEKFCQDKDLYNSIRKAILILDGQDKEYDKGAIPALLSDSLGISFDTNIGHDFLEDYESRYDFYHRKEERLEFDIELLNKITKGGLPRKSMTVLLATTGGGKSLMKCHMAATNLMYGKNVLYITMEMAEEKISQRIDANLLDVTLDELSEMPRDAYEKKINRIKSKTTGKLIVKEYPTGSAHAGHFRHMLNELRLKKNFTPDIIFIDYLNICASSRVKGAAAANSYTLVKSIAEEIRGLAMEFNVPIVTSSQFNRTGYCLDLDTLVETGSGKKKIKDLQIGDVLLSNDGYNKVKNIFEQEEKEVYLIRTKSGKSIICSEDHMFPTGDLKTELSIKSGLAIGHKLFIK